MMSAPNLQKNPVPAMGGILGKFSAKIAYCTRWLASLATIGSQSCAKYLDPVIASHKKKRREHIVFIQPLHFLRNAPNRQKERYQPPQNDLPTAPPTHNPYHIRAIGKKVRKFLFTAHLYNRISCKEHD